MTKQKEERMKARGTWKNNPDYKRNFSITIYRDKDGNILPINDLIEKKFFNKEKRAA